MEKTTNIKLRISESAKYFSMSVREFEKKCNINRGTLGSIKEDQSINSNILSRIIDNAPQINIVWLITGKGEMISKSSENYPQTVEDEKPKYAKMDLVAEYLVNRIKDLEKENSELKEKVKSTEK